MLFCFDRYVDKKDFLSKLQFSFNEAIKIYNYSDFPLPKLKTGLYINYFEENDIISHNYYMKILQNSLGFYSDLITATSIQTGFKYENIEGCMINYGKMVKLKNIVNFNKKCCLTMIIKKYKHLKKPISLCINENNELHCIYKIKSLQNQFQKKCNESLYLKSLQDNKIQVNQTISNSNNINNSISYSYPNTYFYNNSYNNTINNIASSNDNNFINSYQFPFLTNSIEQVFFIYFF